MVQTDIKKEQKQTITTVPHISEVARGFAGARGLGSDALLVTLSECDIQFLFLPQKTKCLLPLSGIETSNCILNHKDWHSHQVK